MDEPWVILGHEMCGHPKSNADNSSRPDQPESHTRHETTKEGDRSAIDVENQIRREHGQGYRLGSISAPRPTSQGGMSEAGSAASSGTRSRSPRPGPTIRSGGSARKERPGC